VPGTWTWPLSEVHSGGHYDLTEGFVRFIMVIRLSLLSHPI
jgi:hypothetical protein